LIGLDPADKRPLLARYDLARAGRTLRRKAVASRREGGLWRWRELLPVRDSSFIAYLGEGDTPLQPWRAFGMSRLFVKRESQNPTGSFKARGMAVAVSRAVELGAKRVVAPSAGNAGGALAAYAAAAGVRATVIMPADAPPTNQVEVRITGADLVLLDGLIDDCGRLAAMVRDELGAFDLSTLKEPYRVEGKKTMGFEIAEQMGWRLPDAIVYPTGGGTGIVGMWKAFDELQAIGLVGGERPRMFSVQAEGCAPIVRAFQAGERFAQPWKGATTAAAGLRVPSAVGDFLILDCLRASGGGAVAVSERDIDDTRSRLGRLGLGYVSLETASAAAGLKALVESGDIGTDETCVLFDTGAGFKSDPPGFPPPDAVANDEALWKEKVIPGLG
jgi:threonine synthase